MGSKLGWANLVDNPVARPQLDLAGKREEEQPTLWEIEGVEKLTGDRYSQHLLDRAMQSDTLLLAGKL